MQKKANTLSDLLYDILRRGDGLLLVLCIIASTFGLVLIYSATRYMESNRFIIVQLVALVFGIIGYCLVSLVDIEEFVSKLWPVLFIFNTLFILTLLTPLGLNIDGNKNWLDLSKLHIPFNVQPAEIVKITFILILVYQVICLQQYGRNLNQFNTLLQPCLHLLFMVGLIIIVSGDFGTSMIYIFITIVILWTAGVKLRWFVGFTVLASIGSILIWRILPYTSLWESNYQVRRIRSIFDHNFDALGIGYQQTRSLLAIGSGQLTGAGYMQGIQTQSPYSSALPARHTDFIFAVCGEEFGLVGCFVLLISLALIIIRCIYIGLHAQDKFSAYICIGFSSMLIAQIGINVGMCLYVFPVAGLTLPFYSYGGSSLLATFICMGIVSSIKAKTKPEWLRN